jgi:hypothetical protein
MLPAPLTCRVEYGSGQHHTRNVILLPCLPVMDNSWRGDEAIGGSPLD